MKDELENKSVDANSNVEKRRSVLKKMGISIPAIITLSSRPAYGAGFCSLSGFASVNPSGVLRHANQHCNGFSQGAWSTPYSGDGVWPLGCIPNPESENKLFPLHKLVGALQSTNTILADRIAKGTTLFYSGQVFSSGSSNNWNVIPPGWPADLSFTLHDALLYGDELAREAAAAFLNAKAAPTDPKIDNFHFTVTQVQDLFNVGQSWVDGKLVPEPGLNSSEFIALFQAAQH